MSTIAPDRTPLASDATTAPHWIGGEAVHGGIAGNDIVDPATGGVIGRVSYADDALIERAVAAAAAAFPAWRDTPWPRRAAVMFEFRTRLRERIEDIAAVITAEHGKTLEEARQEVLRGLDAVDLATGIGTTLKGQMSEQVGRGVDTFSSLHPIGVGVAVSPFNFPALLAIMPIAAAIAAGNALILKPSERDPGASIIIAEAAREAGVPAGILSVVHGNRPVVEALIDHPDVKAVTFVGSTQAARSVYARAGERGKRAQTLGSAKNHLVVLPDADLDATVDAVVSGAFGATGQRCMAVSVVVAVGDIADELVARVVDASQGIVVGAGTDSVTQMGPIISAAARDRVRRIVGDAVDGGADAVLDRREVEVEGYEGGFYVGPVVLDHVTTDMEAYREEIFGPVLSVVRVDTLDTAIELIRDNPYGNGAALFTSNGSDARRFEREVEAGQVGINVPVPVPIATFGSAGWNDSIFGDTQMNAGSVGFWTRTKFVTTRW